MFVDQGTEVGFDFVRRPVEVVARKNAGDAGGQADEKNFQYRPVETAVVLFEHGADGAVEDIRDQRLEYQRDEGKANGKTEEDFVRAQNGENSPPPGEGGITGNLRSGTGIAGKYTAEGIGFTLARLSGTGGTGRSHWSTVPATTTNHTGGVSS